MTSDFDMVQALIGEARKGDAMALELVSMWVDAVHEAAHDFAREQWYPMKGGRPSDHFLALHPYVGKAQERMREYLNKKKPYGEHIRF